MNCNKLFAEYVIETFLTNDKKGEFAALVIDEQFIESTASKLNITPNELVESLRKHAYYRYYSTNTDFSVTIAAIALQLYAASKRQTDDEYSAEAYNPRLCEILRCDISYLQSWYRDNQTSIWQEFYKWCRNHNFQVQECLPRENKNKYIQYPLELARYLLNRDDLKYIASIFKKYRLEPYEDIFYSDFWKILDIRFDFRRLNSHIPKVFDAVYQDTNNYDIVKSQIYNYYLTWNGDNIDFESLRTQRAKSKDSYNLHLSDKDGTYRIDVRKDDDSKVAGFQLDLNLIQDLEGYYSFRREGIIIFQRDYNGDLNYWDETRFIEDKDSIGMAVVFNNSQRIKFYGSNVLFRYRDIAVYEIRYNHLMSEFYSDGEKSYTLLGGLRVSRNTYLVGGDPIWRVLKDCDCLIDGNTHSIEKGDHIFDLEEGDHIIKFPKSRNIKITITPTRKRTDEWINKRCKWEVDRKHDLWRSSETDFGIVGLNFECYSKTNNQCSPLQNWMKLHQNVSIKPTRNIALKLLKNINKYE